MTPKEERAYLEGQQALARRIFRDLLPELGGAGHAERWRIERGEVIAMLRQACEAFGDNDWSDELHLADVIDKHLWRHLEAAHHLRRKVGAPKR